MHWTIAEGTSLGSVELHPCRPTLPESDQRPTGCYRQLGGRAVGSGTSISTQMAGSSRTVDGVFPMESSTAGLLAGKRDLGWLWTEKKSILLYQNAQGGWLYFYGSAGTLLFYDYEAKRWISREDRR